ncbi:MAG: RES domain-containing protein [bacterium]|nr:RES domain-containing protein [bacterium]
MKLRRRHADQERIQPRNVTAYRVTKRKRLERAFDGGGARINGGRWNSPGVRMVYTSGSIALATLEMLVHLEDERTLAELYDVIPVQFDEALCHTIDLSALSVGWNLPVVNPLTQLLGDEWIQRGESAILRVPSVVTPAESPEWNYLLNPLHPDFARIGIGASVVLSIDPRLRGGE